MRDPVRIQRILDKLAAIWRIHPDLRLAQLLCGVIFPQALFLTPPHSIPDPFYLEDEKLEAELDKWMAAHHIAVSGGWQS